MTLHVDGPRRGTWKDFEVGQGGGVLALLAHIESLDKPATVDWLRRRGFLDTDSPASATPSSLFSEPDGKRCDYARRLWHRSTEIPLDTRTSRACGWRKITAGGQPYRWARPSEGSPPQRGHTRAR